MPSLVDAIADVPAGALRLRTATLASWTSGSATITLAEQAIPDVPYLASYSPAIGDVVHVLQLPNQLLILGRSAT